MPEMDYEMEEIREVRNMLRARRRIDNLNVRLNNKALFSLLAVK